MASARNRDGIDARRRGDLDRAEAAHLRALAWYSEAGVHGGVAFTESCLGFLAAERGDEPGAAQHHSAALTAATAADDPARLALALEGLATVGDDADRSAALLGAAARLRSATAGTDEPTHRADVAAVEAATRGRLGDAVFAAAVARGAGLDDSAVLALAQSVT